MIIPTDSVTTLSVDVDVNLSMDKQIANVFRAIVYQLEILQWFETISVSCGISYALIPSRLDMCNSLLHGFNKTQIQQLQRLQNTAARCVKPSSKFTYINHILKLLHWLPFESDSCSTFPCLYSIHLKSIRPPFCKMADMKVNQIKSKMIY